MKTTFKNIIVKLCPFFFLLVSSTMAFGQYVGDSVIVYIDNKLEIKIAIDDYSKLKSSGELPEMLDKFQAYLPDIEGKLSAESADLIKYDSDSLISIEAGDTKEIFLLNNGKAQDTGLRDRAVLTNQNFKVIITSSDILNMKDLAISDCLKKVIDMLPQKATWSKSLYYQCIDNQVTFLKEKTKTNSQIDFLELSFGAGAGVVKNLWVTDISLRLGFGFNKKGVLKHNPYVSSNLVFDFPEEVKVNINTFLNLGYRWNIAKKTEKAKMLGVELGYLISKQGNMFEKNTTKLGFNWSPGDGVVVSPQLYFSGGFTKVYPGVRIGFGL